MKCPRVGELPPPPPDCTGWPWTAESRVLPELQPDGNAWPRISIVTPNYNSGRFLEETIRSILLQGYPDLEYIVVDGGSSDDSLDIIRKYEPWLTWWVSEKDSGFVEAVDKGFQRATGEVMAWLNSDDMYLPDAFARVTAIFRDVPQLEWITTALPLFWNEDGDLSGSVLLSGVTRNWFYRGWHMMGCLDRKRAKRTVQQESTFWRRPLWERAGGRMDRSLRIMGDCELWARFFLHGNLAVVDAPLGAFRMHAASGSVTLRDECIRVATEILRPYRARTIQNQLALWAVEKLVAWTGRGHHRFGSPLIRVRYNFNKKCWYCINRCVV